MKIPPSIHMNGCEIYIQFKHNLIRDEEKFGYYSTADMTIYIDESMSDQKKEVIFFHELLEAIKDVNLIKDEDFDHSAIQPIALSFYELIMTKQIVAED
jgi:hypothetical protein